MVVFVCLLSAGRAKGGLLWMSACSATTQCSLSFFPLSTRSYGLWFTYSSTLMCVEMLVPAHISPTRSWRRQIAPEAFQVTAPPTSTSKSTMNTSSTQ